MRAGHGAAVVSLYGRLRNRHVRENVAGAGPEVPRILRVPRWVPDCTRSRRRGRTGRRRTPRTRSTPLSAVARASASGPDRTT